VLPAAIGGLVELDGVGKRVSTLDYCRGRVRYELGEKTHEGLVR